MASGACAGLRAQRVVRAPRRRRRGGTRSPRCCGAVREEVVERVLEPARLPERDRAHATCVGSTGPSSTNARTRSGYAPRSSRRGTCRTSTRRTTGAVSQRDPQLLEVAHRVGRRHVREQVAVARRALLRQRASSRRPGRPAAAVVAGSNDWSKTGSRMSTHSTGSLSPTPSGVERDQIEPVAAPPRATKPPPLRRNSTPGTPGPPGFNTSVPMRRSCVARPGPDHREVERRRRCRCVDRHREGGALEPAATPLPRER